MGKQSFWVRIKNHRDGLCRYKIGDRTYFLAAGFFGRCFPGRIREVAQGYGTTVIDIGEKPAGWMGKPYACFKEAGQAQGDLFLFLDADTFFEKGGFGNILDCFNQHQRVLSIQPFYKIQRLYEIFFAYFNLILMASMNNCTPLDKKAKTIGAFGPALMISRKDYFVIDGHWAAKGKVLEDLAIGQKIIKKDIPLYCFEGKAP